MSTDREGNTVTLDLIEPLTTAGGEVIKQITLRSPTLREIEEIGALVTLRSAGDIQWRQINYPALSMYLRRCIGVPGDVEAWLDDLCCADTLRLIEAMLRLARSVHTAALAMPGLPY